MEKGTGGRPRRTGAESSVELEEDCYGTEHLRTGKTELDSTMFTNKFVLIHMGADELYC